VATLAQPSFQFVPTHRFFGLSLCDDCQIVEIVHEASIPLQREDDTSPLPFSVRDIASPRHRTTERLFREHGYLITHQREPCREIAREQPGEAHCRPLTESDSFAPGGSAFREAQCTVQEQTPSVLPTRPHVTPTCHPRQTSHRHDMDRRPSLSWLAHPSSDSWDRPKDVTNLRREWRSCRCS